MSAGFFPSGTVTLVLLLLNALQDLRKREILPRFTAGILTAGVIRDLVFSRSSFPLFLAGLLPGLVVLALAVVLRGEIGGGDGLVLLAAGAWLRPETLLSVLLTALLLVLVSALFFLPSGKLRRIWKNGVPFVPYLLGGYVLVLLADLL